MHSRLAAIVRVLFPPRCVTCRARGSWLCPDCRPELALIEDPVCPRCGLTFFGSDCEHCHAVPPHVTALRVTGYYRGALREAVHRLKFSGERYLAEPLGVLMAECWQRNPLPLDAIVPVPLHPSRRARRGYNQSQLLACEVGKLLGVPVLAEGVLRVRDTPPQVGLPRAQRLVNLAGAFTCPDSACAGLRLALIDDVATTGATLSCCADALRAAGAADVHALVLARAL